MGYYAYGKPLRFKVAGDQHRAKAWMVDANRKELATVYDEIEAGPTMEEREQQDLKNRVKLAKDTMRTSLDSRGGGKLPPGRGGEGPSINEEDKGKEK